MTNPLPRACNSINDLNVGDTFRLEYSISDSDVQKFGEISGDFNPAHFNEEYAKGTIFKTRIAHGMISVAKFSGIFGMDVPGLGAIWGNQNVTFLAPVQLDEPYTAVSLLRFNWTSPTPPSPS
jgi:3-hydroxybutyryl-CoA dehydratase